MANSSPSQGLDPDNGIKAWLWVDLCRHPPSMRRATSDADRNRLLQGPSPRPCPVPHPPPAPGRRDLADAAQPRSGRVSHQRRHPRSAAPSHPDPDLDPDPPWPSKVTPPSKWLLPIPPPRSPLPRSPPPVPTRPRRCRRRSQRRRRRPSPRHRGSLVLPPPLTLHFRRLPLSSPQLEASLAEARPSASDRHQQETPRQQEISPPDLYSTAPPRLHPRHGYLRLPDPDLAQDMWNLSWRNPDPDLDLDPDPMGLPRRDLALDTTGGDHKLVPKELLRHRTTASPPSLVASTISDVDPADHDDVTSPLYDCFRCLPVFLPTDLHHRFYHGFCKHYLWPVFHYLLPLSSLTSSHRFDRGLFRAYLSANKLFADRVMEMLSPDDDDDDDDGDNFVWIHDYHLMALPTYLRKRSPRAKLGFFLHSPFPSSEIFKTIPVREELVRALLNSDLIGFHTFDYARHFLTCCSRMLGLDYESKRGHIGIEYYGRTVSIKILPVGIDMGQLRSLVSMKETEEKVKELVDSFEGKGKILLLGVDDLDMFKGIGFKFLAMEQLLEEHRDLIGKAVLVQIANPARSHGKDVQEVQEEIHSVMGRVNRRFGRPGYDPIVFINRKVPTYEEAAYYAVAECCVVNPVRDGLNLMPYKYTVCRQWSPALASSAKRSVIVVSEFIGCSPSLSGAIRVNPWNVDAVAEGINLAITMPEAEKQLRHDKHYKYVSSHDVAYWAKSFDQDLQRACRDHYLKRCWGIGFGLSFRVVALGPNFRKLSVEHIASAYRRTNSRLILLDYDGTMMPESSIDKTPSEELVSLLNGLCADPKNVVFVVSGRGKDSLSKWFDPCEKLGISAEHGYFTRWSRDSPWESCHLVPDFDWKEIAEPVMKHYTEATDGSYIEHKDSALVWHHQEADPDFGSWQAKELLDHLENVLANEPVAVKRGQHIVEVNPQGISKGVVVENLISTMLSREKSPDFVLCVGDDRSDEDMFESIMSAVSNPSLPAIAEVFNCTVGKKPSKAKYYLDDTVDVIKMLQGLASASAQPPKRPNLQVSFEGSL